jgi:YegS/Rv2252/BmrU family lipid kinase
MPTYKIIANPVAGRGNGARAVPAVDRILSQARVSFDLVETRGPNEATALALQAALDGFASVVAVGGDGTVHEVVNGLVQARDGKAGPDGACLGIVPVGAGNDFAWSMGLPLNDPEAACRVLLGDCRRVVDLARATDERGQSWVFNNMLGAGFDAATALEASKIQRLRGLPLYLLAVLRTIPRYSQAPQVTVCFNGQCISRSMLMICVANGRRGGGGFLLAPHALLDDGLLDVTLAGDAGPLVILGLLPHFVRGTHATQTRYVSSRRASHLVIEAPAGMPMHLEGEIVRTDARRIEIGVLPRSLAVISASG